MNRFHRAAFRRGRLRIPLAMIIATLAAGALAQGKPQARAWTPDRPVTLVTRPACCRSARIARANRVGIAVSLAIRSAATTASGVLARRSMARTA